MSTSESGQPPAESAPSAADADLPVGAQVGEYVIDGKLGEGGFGAVFRASHPLIGKQVAIKVLNRHYSASPQMVSRFIAEARAVNQIRHRHIIDIFAFGQLPDGRHYYVMELLAGRTLDAHLAAHGGRLALVDAIPILRAVAKALDAAHAAGIAHRDLKPENIFIADDDGAPFPKLLDFGIAKLLGASDAAPHAHKTRTGVPMGTPYYMSPEQCRGREVDHRTDIYSFGIVVYQLLTGVMPFDGADYMEILLKQVHDAPAPLTRHVADLPAALDRLVPAIMAKDPAARPATLVAAVRALEEVALAAGLHVPGAPLTQALDTPPPPSDPRIPASSALATAAAPTADLHAPRPTPSRRPRWAALTVLTVAALATVLALTTRQPATEPAGQGRAPTAAPSAPTPAASAPTPAAPAITLDLRALPDGTEVIAPDGTILGVAPGPLSLPRATAPLALTLRKPGYRLHRIDLVPDADAPLSATLVPLDAPPEAPPAPAASVPAKPSKAHSSKPRSKDKNALEDFD